MADASHNSSAKKIPDNLYQLCLTNLVNYLHKFKCGRDVLRGLPDTILMDVYYKMLQEKRLCILGSELADLDTFERLLRYSGHQLKLLQCFQAVIEYGSMLSTELASVYLTRVDQGTHTKHQLILLGLSLGGFLNEAGWYADARTVLETCRDLCRSQPRTTHYRRLTLECCHRLLNTQSAYCCFPAAAETYSLALKLLGHSDESSSSLDHPGIDHYYNDIDVCDKATQTDDDDEICCRLQEHEECPIGRTVVEGMGSLLPRLYKEFSALFFVRCDYNAAYSWSMKALKLLTPDTPPKVVIEVLRACGKACVVKRQFCVAGALLRGAAARARRHYGVAHPRSAAAHLDLGFYLLNVDQIPTSVAVYEEALSTLRLVFGRSSLHVATAQEDLAYALYVMEYSTGRFYKAREHAERAIRIIENLVPPDHLLLASAKRVKALILEEIALDAPAGQAMSEPNLLKESEALHKAALNLSMLAFGEKNVQTAKHYGNLGRLYQSMQKFEDAEAMHLKAIAIKEELLGAEDYEVGLSIGHLASLYNYHMDNHLAAAKLYFRSIAISLKLFGERYSGLEYDYRGLVHVFTKLKQHDRADLYNRLLHHWHELREQSRTEQQPSIEDEEVLSLDELRAQLFSPNAD